MKVTLLPLYILPVFSERSSVIFLCLIIDIEIYDPYKQGTYQRDQ